MMAERVSHPWTGALDGLAGGTTEAVARFRYDLISGRWWWSKGLYALHGFAPGEVIPSSELLLAHKHPDDRTRTAHALHVVMDTGEPFCCRHRVLDAGGAVHTVLALGEGVRDTSGTVTAIQGFYIDVTDSVRRDTEAVAHEAVRRSAETRATIEQAKGVLIGMYGIDADTAFDLLRWSSQQTNTKLRLVAANLVDHFTHRQAAATSARHGARGLLQAISESSVPDIR